MLIPAIVIVALITVAIFAVVAYTIDPPPPKLGWMSEEWLAEYRASRAP